jgi:hypothetical protein
MHHKRLVTIVIASAALLIFLGCTVSGIGIDTVDVGEIRTESVTVQPEDADQVRVILKMGAGELKIDDGADGLMEADFTFNVDAWEPTVTYNVSAGAGRLTVEQPKTEELSVGSNFHNEWDIRFGDGIPLDMRIDCGAGEQDIDLGGLTITELDMKLGAGDVNVDLSDNAALTRLKFDIGAGDVDINLDGPWDNNVDVDIQGGIGQTKLRLPRDVGVRVNVTKGIGDVDASGLYRNGNDYVNDAYGESDITLEINLQAGIGRVQLDVRP